MATSVTLGRVVGSLWYTGNQSTNEGIASELNAAGYKPLRGDLYLNITTGAIYKYAADNNTLTWKLTANILGPKGEGFSISKIYASISAMNAGYSTDSVPVGGFVIIETGDVNNPDNSKLYVKGDAAYQFVTDMSGTIGLTGPMPVFSPVVSVTITAPDTAGTASITGAGTGADPYKLILSVPKGNTGATGNGISNIEVSGTTDSNGYTNTTLQITYTNGTNQEVTIKAKHGRDGTNGQNGVGITTVTAGTPTVSGNKTTTPITISKTDNTSQVVNVVAQNGTNGTNGTNGIDGKTPEMSINSDGELIATFN